MRWSIVRVIWLRELKDQLRDRRTLFMIAVLPIVLYPLLGVGMGMVAGNFGQDPQIVGIYGIENLPRFAPNSAVAWLTATPCPGASLSGVERAASAEALDLARQIDAHDSFPPLLVDGPDDWHTAPAYLEPEGPRLLQVRP